MKQQLSTNNWRAERFNLRELFEYVTISAILWAFAGKVGIASTIALLFMSLALAARQGAIALLMVILASLLADWHGTSAPLQQNWLPQCLVLLLALALAVYVRFRRLGHKAL